MYFAGMRTIVLTSGFAGSLTISVYDLFVAAIALLLLGFFILTATQETIRLMKANK
jgi:hypothetical protein